MKPNLYPVIILAGGLATRLRPATETIPKSLMLINNEPYINHQLRLLHRQGIRSVVLCVSYLGEMIEEYIGDGKQFGMQVQYSYDGSILLGTAGAIKKALHCVEEAFFVLYGDSYLTCDYVAIQTAFQHHAKQGLMTVFHNAGQWDTSNIEFTDGKIIAYDKQYRNERMQYIDYGLGVFKRDAFADLYANEAYDLALLYQMLLKKNQLAAFEVNERFYEVGSFAGIKELEVYLS